jgi:thiol:disulfide interchange protein
MLGLFEIVLPGKVTNIQIVRKGYIGALGMGVLATLLATPCSAPLLGPVLTWALSQPTTVTVVVFIVVGIGMAAPYVILTAFPKLLHRIPKAGTWMIRLKQGLGFVMLGVAAYLIFLFPAGWHLPLIIFCLLLTLAIWLSWQVVNYASSSGHKIWARVIALILIGLGGILLARTRPDVQEETTQNWLVAELVPLHQEGKNVMVEFTADWCPNCKYVEKTVLKREAFREKLKEKNTKLIIADLTHKDPAITEVLEKLGSKSIPFTAVFPGNDYLRPIVLRDIYTLDTVLDVLDTLE